MNVIEYLETQPDCFEIFRHTFDMEFQSIRITDSFGEGGTNLCYIEKTKVNNKTEAIMTLVVQDFVRYGDYSFLGVELEEIYQIVFNHLRDYYSMTEFKTSESVPSLLDCMKRYENSDAIKKINMNYNWSEQVELIEISTLKIFDDNVLTRYQLLTPTKWSFEDYFYETDNFYIRYNWSTGA